MELDDLVTSLMKQLYRVSNAESVVGKPMKFADAAVVPMCRISVGFGTGSGDVTGDASKRGAAVDLGGAGGGLTVEPRAFVVVGKGGHAQLLSVRRGAKAILQRAIDILPDTVNQVLPAKSEDQK
ncbi:MAG: hypothetical protein FWD57_02760 [Polyangiaceae bacterium]|nr:hypothetical protein [Polyangiaceae bacterium]